ncbi:MAG TPA: transcription elongation factor GreB [Oligoflexia bacterium]|nr:transcription elongation factor GreB [Oligoflexia bacterium]HMP26595.1 transcription elongation factor GreB [Oligoflexia bacterium]
MSKNFFDGSNAINKDYITPIGYAKLLEELHRLKNVERPEVTKVVSWAAVNGDRSENADYQYGKRKLREIDRKIEFLSKKLDCLQVIDPLATPDKNSVFFGATVTIVDVIEAVAKQKIYRIVGVDEVDVAKGKISWRSPLGAALFKSKIGDLVRYQTPSGEKEVKVVKIEYVVIE